MPDDQPTCTGIYRCGPCNDCVPKEEPRGSRMPDFMATVPLMAEEETE